MDGSRFTVTTTKEHLTLRQVPPREDPISVLVDELSDGSRLDVEERALTRTKPEQSRRQNADHVTV
jgi:hypothetical protein